MYKRDAKISKYRIVVEEFHEWTEVPSGEDLMNLQEGQPAPGERRVTEWVETDHIEVNNPIVLAGILRSKADSIDPQ